MHKLYLKLQSTLLCLYLIYSFSFLFGQNLSSTTIDLQKARVIIDSLDKVFSQKYFDGDSVAIYKMYAKDATLGCLEGDKILAAWGREIRKSIKEDTRNLIFVTTSLSTDGEFIAELGIFEVKDSKGNSKDKGKYLVIWKQEHGTWKLYRDMEL